MNDFDCVNYVITHKPYELKQDGTYRVLCVGGCEKEGCLAEKDGENIAEFNDRINELTGLYWIWKNTGTEYPGMCHYRRFFRQGVWDGRRIEKDRIREILADEKQDIILSEKIRLPWTVNMNISLRVGMELMCRGYAAFMEEIIRAQPDYEKDFTKVMADDRMYVCNMFITRREVMEKYCEWLFSFLLEATKKISVEGCTEDQKRVAGFFGETMWTVWMRHQDLKVKELPVGRRMIEL